MIISSHSAKSKLLSNSLVMMVLQATQLLIPLLLMPFVIKTYGIEAFGLLSFATALCMFFNVLCEYGFNLTSTKAVSVSVGKTNELSSIFSKTISAKLILLLACVSAYAILVWSFDVLRQNWLIYALTFGFVIGNTLLPLWLYQGLQDFKLVSIVNIGLKIGLMLLIFLVVDGQNDLYKVPLFISLGYIVPSIWSLAYAVKKYNLSFRFPTWAEVCSLYQEGWHIFISRLAVFLYTSTNIIVLEVFTSTAAVGYYAVASRIISALSSVLNMVNQVLFPYLSQCWKQDRKGYFVKLTTLAKVMFGLMCLIVAVLQFISPFVIEILTGNESELSVMILRILSVALILMPLGGLFTQSFVTQGQNWAVSHVTLQTTCVNFIFVCLLAYLYGAVGMAIAVCLVQVFHVIMNLFYLSKLKGRSSCAA